MTTTKFQLFNALATGGELMATTRTTPEPEQVRVFHSVSAVQRESGDNKSWNVTGTKRSNSTVYETIFIRTID